MKKVSIALVLLALLLMVVSMLWRRAIGIGEAQRPLPLSLHASRMLPDAPPATAGAGAVAKGLAGGHAGGEDSIERPRAIALPAITLPAGCARACAALATPRSQPVI